MNKIEGVITIILIALGVMFLIGTTEFQAPEEEKYYCEGEEIDWSDEETYKNCFDELIGDEICVHIGYSGECIEYEI